MDDMPETLIERVAMMEGILVAAATGGSPDGHAYEILRREMLHDDEAKALLPAFVWTSRTLDAFWPYIKDRFGRYQERRAFIRESFTPLMDHLEGRNRAPGDAVVGDALASFDADDPPTEERPRVRPSPRHASLAVNAAGAIATFLVETYQERSKG